MRKHHPFTNKYTRAIFMSTILCLIDFNTTQNTFATTLQNETLFVTNREVKSEFLTSEEIKMTPI